ncbi:MAG: aldehyde dehydrogenase family protein, partial [Synergistaceae bacterium]|nr:aldehyde dehydrogenase family protein [Synergistaceae bacterium]
MAKEVTPEQIEMLKGMVEKARKAADIIATYDQARVDRLCQAVCAAVYPLKIWGPICDEAVDETRLGDKVTKRNKRNKIKLILRDCLRQKSVGVIEEIPEKGLVKYAKPVGVIGVLVPTTNPCLTPAGQVLYAIKARDVIICSPHPRAKKITNKCIGLIRDALVREGAPADIIQGIEEPSISLTQELMKMVDLVIATGGRPMVKSAYSSGTPAYGSGAGNATVIVDETADTMEKAQEAATNTRISKCSDFGSGCSCDGNLVVHESVYENFVKGLENEGAYFPTWEEAEKIKKVMWDADGHRLPDTVAVSPQALAKTAGFEIPADRKFIAVPNNGQKEGFVIRTAEDIKKCIGKEHFFSSEKLTTLLTLF